MKKFYLLLLINLWMTIPCISQKGHRNKREVLDKNYYQKLVVKAGEVVVASVDSIHIDTLVLGDESTLRFQVSAMLIVNSAFIGKQCRLTSSGSDGDGSGQNGEDGKNLKCMIVFRKLENLILDARGGNGKKGSRGMDGRYGTYSDPGGPGKPGGNGGNGGNIKLVYFCDGFNATFNSDLPQSIRIMVDGGKGGEGGQGGAKAKPVGYPGIGKAGLNGKPGNPGLDGNFLIEQIH